MFATSILPIHSQTPDQRSGAGFVPLSAQSHPFGPVSALAPEIAALLAEYDAFYGMPVPATRLSGFVQSGAYRLAIQGFLPQNPRKTVLVAHGYLDHAGYLADMIRWLLANDCGVITYDLPGHGLSSGERGDIGDVADYGDAVAAVIEASREFHHGELVALGHSTGCASLLEYSYRHPMAFSRMIFLAPLVRLVFFSVATNVANLIGGFIAKVPKLPPDATPGLLISSRFILNDPLQFSQIPTHWTRAVAAWNARLDNYPRQVANLFIIQGTNDRVVEWRFNIPYLLTLVKGSEIQYIKDGIHEVYRDVMPRRSQVYRSIARFLDLSKPYPVQ